jgi:hypothetical protein
MKQLIRRAALGTLGVGVIASGMIAMAPTVAANDADVIRTGNCSGASDWKLKVSPEDGRLEVEFEVDQNRNGQVWNVVLKRNGNAFWRGQRTTQAPSGSFEVRKLTRNGAGTDTIVGRATNPKTGEVCRGTVNF